MKLLKYIGIVIATIIGLVIAFETGPLRRLGTTFAINEAYFQTIQLHYFYSGLLAAVFACSFAYLFKASIMVVSVLLFVTGILWVAFSQSSDPDFLRYLTGAIIEFMLPYLSVCAGVVAITYGVNKKWPRLS